MDLHQLSCKTSERSAKFAEIVQACRYILKNSPIASEEMKYVKRRMSSHAIDKFGIGYFPSEDNLDVLLKYVSMDTLEELNLVKPYYIRERGGITSRKRVHLENHNLVIPYKDEYGNTIALAGRALLSKEERKDKKIPKYKNSLPFDKKLHLYGLSYAKRAACKSDSIIVVEGQIDCISCHSHGYHNVVALTGSSLTRWQIYLLRKMASKIYLLLDNDDPGSNAVNKILNKRYSKLSDIEIVSLPEGYEDVDEYLTESGNCTIFDRIT